jgi:hypothetical protein
VEFLKSLLFCSIATFFNAVKVLLAFVVREVVHAFGFCG